MVTAERSGGVNVRGSKHVNNRLCHEHKIGLAKHPHTITQRQSRVFRDAMHQLWLVGHRFCRLASRMQCLWCSTGGVANCQRYYLRGKYGRWRCSSGKLPWRRSRYVVTISCKVRTRTTGPGFRGSSAGESRECTIANGT